jgi:aminoglycoside 6'-N-acetyltransferase I
MIVQIHTFNPDWLKMRHALWSDTTHEEHRKEIEELLAAPENCTQFIAYSNNGDALGFAEASIRREYVNGTNSSPVTYLEGIYVKPQARRMGLAAALIEAVADWGQSKGCEELASDVELENQISQEVHKALGFIETERVVYFMRPLVNPN